ncbi:RecA RecA/RadA recombinase [uncultured Caudovirales phage]|uniref:RecA RecA/RadA recombinase n=1 Tax=uncultured Caudovirales phage TaxID=2100421 RepID=A0A6J5L9P3_9CAUD|nr:RecA RecA/RadA recombinase [uncultured Caudovirales phage]
MGKPFDLSKFRKSITKSIDGISVGFNDPKTWISTGNYALNYLISGDFNKGVPLGKITVFAGDSGAGKSYFCSGNIVKAAQDQGIYVVLIDSENALDESWLHALGVKTTEDKLLKVNMAMIDDVAKMISEFVKEYKTLPDTERPKVLFVIDSLGMLLTPTDVNQFEAGEMKGDMGRKPKALTSLVRNCVNMFGDLDIGMVVTNHTYASQDPYNPDPNISGGQGFIYASSIVVAMKKLKLKEDEDGNKTTTVNGIRAGCKIMKTRYNKPFEDIEVRIPYDTGMNPLSGLFDLLEKRGLITKDGNRYSYIDLNGEIHKYFRKEWNKNENGIFDLVMSEFHEKEARKAALAAAQTATVEEDALEEVI